MNTNIADYSIEDLLAVLNIHETNPTESHIKAVTRHLIAQLKTENKQKLTVFLENAERKIIAGLFQPEDDDYSNQDGEEADADADEADEVDADGDEVDGVGARADGVGRDGAETEAEEEEDVAYTNDRANIQYDENTQQGNWWQNQYPAQTTDENERSKPTDRKQKVQIFDPAGKDNTAFVMNRERLGVLQSHPIPYVQGTINPTLKTTINRIVSIDSQYRPNVIPYAGANTTAPTFNTDFSFDLTERLSNVVSLTLNSIQIPTSWYIFDDALGNTCFKYQDGTAEPIFIKMPSGNYTLPYLNKFFTNVTPPISLQLSYDEVTGKLLFSSTSPTVTLIFYDTSNFNSCVDNSCSSTQMRINQNFGWTLGFRTTDENLLYTTLNSTVQLSSAILPASVGPYFSIAQSPANLYGPAYFMLVLDDYNNNRVNNSLVTITNVSNKVDLPSYYSPAIKNANNTFATVGCLNNVGVLDPALKNVHSVLPYMTKSSPRQLTQSQLYTANEILYNRTTYSNRVVGPSTADVLALLPLSNISTLRSNIFYDATGQVSLSSNQVSQPYVVFGPPLAMYRRTYFGPVNIDRMRVRLLDDKSNLVNLNDADWSFSLVVEQLYQY